MYHRPLIVGFCMLLCACGNKGELILIPSDAVAGALDRTDAEERPKRGGPNDTRTSLPGDEPAEQIVPDDTLDLPVVPDEDR